MSSGAEPAVGSVSAFAPRFEYLRVTDLRPAPLREVSLVLPPGEWIPASAAAPALAGDGPARLQAPEGFHRLFHSRLPLRLDLFVWSAGSEARCVAHPF